MALEANKVKMPAEQPQYPSLQFGLAHGINLFILNVVYETAMHLKMLNYGAEMYILT